MSSSVPSSTLRPAEDHEDAVAHPLRGGHVVRAEHDRCASSSRLEHRVLQRLRVHRVQPGKRFVENEQGRLRDDGGDELDFLRHAFGERFDLAIGPLPQTEPREPLVDQRVELGEGAALQPAVVAKQPPDGHPLI